MLSERRLFPRHSLQFPVEMKVEHAEGRLEVQADAVTLSLSALEVNADAELVKAFLKQDIYPQVGEVSFRLPGHEYTFRMRCQLGLHRRLSQHQWQLVLLFTRYHDDCGGLLAEYLGCPLPPPPQAKLLSRFK